MTPKLKPPGTKRLKVTCDIILSTSAFKFILRLFIKRAADASFLAEQTKLEGAHVGPGRTRSNSSVFNPC